MPLTPPTAPRSAIFADPLLATPDCPLRGLVVLLVEDSRFAAEALRLVCRRTGARLRRAETLAAARTHLRAYRPDVVLVDLGLPDGRGERLIESLAALTPRPVILATSGDPDAGPAARAAGAAGFIAKPVTGVASFLDALLPLLPDRACMPGRVALPAPLSPDPLALRDDLARATALLGRDALDAPPGHAADFVQSLARSMGDPELEARARAARADPAALPALRRAVRNRLAGCPSGVAP